MFALAQVPKVFVSLFSKERQTVPSEGRRRRRGVSFDSFSLRLYLQRKAANIKQLRYGYTVAIVSFCLSFFFSRRRRHEREDRKRLQRTNAPRRGQQRGYGAKHAVLLRNPTLLRKESAAPAGETVAFKKSSAKTLGFWRVRTQCVSPTNQNGSNFKELPIDRRLARWESNHFLKRHSIRCAYESRCTALSKLCRLPSQSQDLFLGFCESLQNFTKS